MTKPRSGLSNPMPSALVATTTLTELSSRSQRTSWRYPCFFLRLIHPASSANGRLGQDGVGRSDGGGGMAQDQGQGTPGGLPEDLQALGVGVKSMLVQMAKNAHLLELRCEMPTCYREQEDPNGRQMFDRWPDPPYAPGHDWSPNADHYPTLAKDGGRLKPWNVRLAHVFCNNMDYGWRSRIRRMLEKNPSLSFDKIAEALNRKKNVHKP